MQASVKIAALFFITTLLFLSIGCRKEEGLEGKKIVSGVVYFKNGASGNNDPAASATVFIAYGVKEETGSYDQTTTTNSNGEYSIKGLQKGDYFIKASFTDAHGFSYSTPGYAVQINNKRAELKLDINLE